MSFHIDNRNGVLTLDSRLLPQAQGDYLSGYLKKINHYRAIGFYDGSPVFSLYQPPLAIPAGVRSLEMRLARRFEGKRIPATATLAINRTCQCLCVHCSAVFYNQGGLRTLSTHQWVEAVRQTVGLGVTHVILLGGEPLLRRDLSEIIRAVPKDKAVVTLFTNGEFLSPEKCAVLKSSGLLGAFVSIDSADSGEHDRLRHRPGLFKKAMKGIENLREKGLLVALSSYLSTKNLSQGSFEEMMELGKKVGVNEVTFFDAIPAGAWLKDAGCLLTTEDRSKIAVLVREYRARSGYPGISAQSTMTSPCGSAFCFAANTQFYLTAGGEMCPCDFTPLTIGRFPEETIEALWNRLIRTSPYNERAKSCRMQDPFFRKKYIMPIPDEGPFPYPLLTLEQDLQRHESDQGTRNSLDGCAGE